MNLKDLKRVFEERDIEWRVQQSGIKNDKPWALVLAYVTNRAIMERLDDVCGEKKWTNEFCKGPDGGILCGIRIFVEPHCEFGIIKYDGAENTHVESVKGGLSSAMKRAAVQWGIGRYLYNLDVMFANFMPNGKYTAKIDNKYFKWNPPQLPAFALPKKEQEKKVEIEKMVNLANHEQKSALIKIAQLLDSKKNDAIISRIKNGLTHDQAIELIEWAEKQLAKQGQIK
jgi:hypothetical protein